MKALITSDTHSQDAGLYELKEMYQKEVDLWLHCGDSELLNNDPALADFHVVTGNTDWLGKFPSSEKINFAGLTLLLTHGHLFHVRSGVDELAAWAEKEQADIVFYGHTHIAKVDEKAGKYFINPGSLHFPRGTYRQGSYAILTREANSTQIDFYTEAHEKIEAWSQKLAL